MTKFAFQISCKSVVFKAITITSKKSQDRRLDLAYFADCLLFYEKVNLIADRFVLLDLLKICTVHEIVELIVCGRLNLYIQENFVSVPIFNAPNGEERYDTTTVSSDALASEKTLLKTFEEAGFVGDDPRRAMLLLLKYTKPYKFHQVINDEFTADLSDQQYLQYAIHASIKFFNPDITLTPNQIQARYVPTGTWQGFTINQFTSNIDFSQFQNASPSNVLLNIVEARGDIHIASEFGSEVAGRIINSHLIQHRMNSLFQKVQNSTANISCFQEKVLHGYRSVGEAVKTGEISIQTFIKLLSKSGPFRQKFLSRLNDDDDIVGRYLYSLAKKSLLDRLPVKILRFALFNGAIPTGQLASTALSAGDTFLLDKIAGGYKPNHFIEELISELPENPSA